MFSASHFSKNEMIDTHRKEKSLKPLQCPSDCFEPHPSLSNNTNEWVPRTLGRPAFWRAALPPVEGSQTLRRLDVQHFLQTLQQPAGSRKTHQAYSRAVLGEMAFLFLSLLLLKQKTSQPKSEYLFINPAVALFLCSSHDWATPVGEPLWVEKKRFCLHVSIFFLNSVRSSFCFQPFNWNYFFQRLPVTRVAR